MCQAGGPPPTVRNMGHVHHPCPGSAPVAGSVFAIRAGPGLPRAGHYARSVPSPAPVVRPARTADVRAIRALVAPLAERRVLLNKEAVAYYESVGDFVVAEVDGRVVNDLDRPVLMVAVGNGAHIGGGTEVTPLADPEDGEVDVMISRATSPIAKLAYTLKMARQGSHLERPDVDYYRGRTVSVSGEEFWCSADGEIYGPERKRTWHVEPAAYRFVLPTPAG